MRNKAEEQLTLIQEAFLALQEHEAQPVMASAEQASANSSDDPDHKSRTALPLPPDPLPPAVPFAAIDEAKFQKLLEDYWSGKASLEKTQPLVLRELEILERNHKALCDLIGYATGKSLYESQCKELRKRFVAVFTIARGAKGGAASSAGTTLENLHQYVDFLVALGQCHDILLDPKRRPASIKDIEARGPNDWGVFERMFPVLNKNLYQKLDYAARSLTSFLAEVLPPERPYNPAAFLAELNRQSPRIEPVRVKKKGLLGRIFG